MVNNKYIGRKVWKLFNTYHLGYLATVQIQDNNKVDIQN